MTVYRFDEHTQAIIEKSVIPIWVFQSVDGHISTVAASEGFCRLFGYADKHEAAEKLDSDVCRNVHPDDISIVTEAVSGFENEDKPYNPVYRIMINGSYRCIHASGQHITAETGERLSVMWYIDESDVIPDAKAVQKDDTSGSWEKANKDSLTSVKNKHCFDNYIEDIQKRIEHAETPEVAIGVFDCDNLRKINDQHGHDKGNLYLIASCKLICRVFKHSPVFRVGGDEFAVILSGEDYNNTEDLLMEFQSEQKQIAAMAKKPWEKVSVSFGVAVYCPQFDSSVKDLIRRADQLMYDNKHTRKSYLQNSL